jgi:hypothetical protein
MAPRHSELPKSGPVRAQLVGRDHLRCEALFSKQVRMSHESDGRALVTPALNQHVQDLALVINRTLEVHSFAGNPDNHLVEIPAVARPRTVPPQPSCDHRPEIQHPAADAFVRDVQTSLGEGRSSTSW